MRPGIFNQLSFRGQMAIAFGSLTFVVLLVASVAWGFWTIRLLESQVRQELQARVHGAAELIFEGLRDRSAEIADLSRMPGLVRDGVAQAKLQERLDTKRLLKTEYAWLGLAAPDGRVLASARQLLAGNDVSQRDWFRLAQHSTWIGDVHEAVLLSRLMPREKEREPLRFVDIAAPVLDTQGGLLGVLGAHLHWSWVTRLAESVLPVDAHVRQMQLYILDRRGVTLYPFGETGAISLRQQANISDVAGDLIWADGRRYVTAQAGLRETAEQHLGWRVVLRQPEKVAYAPLHGFVIQMGAITCVVALLAAGLAYRIAAYVNAPLTLLAKAVDELGDEHDQVRVPHALPPELQRLADAIQTASTNLGASRRELVEAKELLEKRVQERTEALGAANAALEQQAMTDGLTQVANRRAFDQKLAEVHALSARTGEGYGLLVIDADFFKRVNDQYGHQVGDSVLVGIAGQLVASLRTTDFVARYGGEEFVVLLYPVKAADELLAVAEKLRGAVECSVFDRVGKITISLGGCLVEGAEAELGAGMQRADAALYEAKRLGRNRVVLVKCTSPHLT